MNVSMEKTDAVSARLTVKVEENDYKQRVAEDLKKIGRTHQIPGFRKGHISLPDLQRRFGRQVTSDVINQVVYEAVMNYIKDNNLNVLGQPLPVEVKELDFKNDKEFTFEYDLALAPELDVKLDKDEHITYYNIEVSQEMMDEQDKALRKRFGSQEPGEEFEPDALVKGSMMQLNEDGTIKEGDDAIQAVSTIVAPFYFKDKDEAAKFEGKKVGDKVVFNPRKACGGDIAELASMLNIDRNRTAEVQGDFELAISEIIVVRLAEHNEDFYKQVFGGEVKTEEEYNAAVKSMIARELAGNSEMLFRADARKYFLGKYGEMQLPAELLKKWLMSREESYNPENIDEAYVRMEDDLKWQLIRENIAEKLNIKIEDNDLMEMAKSIAARQLAQYGMTNMDDETITGFAKNILNDKDFRPRLVEQVGDIKLYDGIKAAVTLDEKNVTLDEVKEIATKM